MKIKNLFSLMCIAVVITNLVGCTNSNKTSDVESSSKITQITSSVESDVTQDSESEREVIGTGESISIKPMEIENAEPVHKYLKGKYGLIDFTVCEELDYSTDTLRYTVIDDNNAKFYVYYYTDTEEFLDNYISYLFPKATSEWEEDIVKYWFTDDKNVVITNNIREQLDGDINEVINKKYYITLLNNGYITWDVFVTDITENELNNFKRETALQGNYNIYIVQSKSEMDLLKQAVENDDELTLLRIRDNSKLYYTKEIFNNEIMKEEVYNTTE